MFECTRRSKKRIWRGTLAPETVKKTHRQTDITSRCPTILPPRLKAREQDGPLLRVERISPTNRAEEEESIGDRREGGRAGGWWAAEDKWWGGRPLIITLITTHFAAPGPAPRGPLRIASIIFDLRHCPPPPTKLNSQGARFSKHYVCLVFLAARH